MSRYKNWIKNAERPDEPDYLVLPYDHRQKRIVAAYNFLICVFLFLIQIAEGFVNQSSSRTFWIFCPYVLVFLPLAYLLAGSASFLGMPVNLSLKQWEKSLGRAKRSCIGVLILESVSGILELIFIISNRTLLSSDSVSGIPGYAKEAAMAGGLRGELIYLGLHILLIAGCIMYGFFYDSSFSNSRRKVEKSI